MRTLNLDMVLLPEEQKIDLARQLLEEFGATPIRHRGDELIHGCLVSDYHTDQSRHPTASLNTTKLLYNCLGCHSGGSLIWLITVCRKCSTEEARKWLEKQTGLDGEGPELAQLLRIHEAIRAQRHGYDPIPAFDPRIVQAWQAELPVDYLTGRGIDPANARQLGLGWDKESDRLVIPHWWDGHLVGWQARRLNDANDWQDKYTATGEFPRDSTIFNYDPTQRTAVVVEAPLSVVRHIHHVPNMIATFGAEVTDRQVRALQRFERIVLAYDNDKSGWRAVEGYDTVGGRANEHHPGIVERLADYLPVYVWENPFDADPADMDDDLFQRLIDTAVPAPLWRRPVRLFKLPRGVKT